MSARGRNSQYSAPTPTSRPAIPKITPRTVERDGDERFAPSPSKAPGRITV